MRCDKNPTKIKGWKKILVKVNNDDDDDDDDDCAAKKILILIMWKYSSDKCGANRSREEVDLSSLLNDISKYRE